MMSNTLDKLERRRFVRIPCWGEVHYNYSPHKDSEEQLNIIIRKHRTRLKNISIVGIQFETKNPPTIDSHIELDIKLSEDTPSLCLNGRVVWSRLVDQDGQYAVGVEFLAASQEDIKHIEEFISRYYA